MKFLFDDEAFSFEALRVTGYAPYGGPDLGEVTADPRRGRDGMAPVPQRAQSGAVGRVDRAADHLPGLRRRLRSSRGGVVRLQLNWRLSSMRWPRRAVRGQRDLSRPDPGKTIEPGAVLE